MWNDLRYGARVLRKNSGFTLTAVATLAVGIGLNATLFSILNFLLLKPIPVSRANEVVWLAGASTGPTPVRERFTLPDLVDFGGAKGAIADVIAFGDARMAVRAGSQAVRVHGQVVTPNYFAVLGVGASAGRVFATADDEAGTEIAAVVSHALAQRLFASPAEALDQSFDINGQAFRVVGVAAQAFHGTDVLSPAELWVPTTAAGAVVGIKTPASRTTWWLRGMARLAPGTNVSQAQAAVNGIAASIARSHPESHKDFAVRLVEARGAGPHDRDALGMLAVLPAVPLMILLIACANVAGLLLARGIGRSREIAVRLAIGASRPQIVRQLLAESLLISLLGGAGAMLVLLWSPELLVRLVGAPLAGDLAPDARVLLFTLVLSVVTTGIFGLVPALRAARGSAPMSLRGEPGAAVIQPSMRLQRGLVAGQLALSLVLLSASGLFLQSLLEAAGADVGFETKGRVTLSVDLKMQRYSDARADAFHRALLERSAAVPGIRSVALASYIPLGGRVTFAPVYLAGQPVNPEEQATTAGTNSVTERFFETLELPIVRGRGLDARDMLRGSTAIVVNETFVRRFCGDGDPIGQRFHLGSPNRPAQEIVGVARDVVIDEFGEDSRPFVYEPHAGTAGEVSLIAAADIDTAAALRALESVVREIDPAVAVFDPRTMAQHLGDRMDSERGMSRILALAGVLALALAACGLYGVVAYTVMRQTREIGVRMALGARAEDVARLFLADGARLAAWGLGFGAVPAIGVGFLMSGALFGIHPADVRAVGAAALVLTAAALLASYLPARRAMRVDPMIALRAE